MLSAIWTIAKNSFVEIIRQPVYVIVLAIGMVLIGFSPAVTMFSMVEEEKMMVDVGLATIMLLGLALAVLSVTQIISREIEAHTVGAILSKPVGRVPFVVAKFLGMTAALALATYLLTIMLLNTLRVGVPSGATWEMDWPALLAMLLPALGAVAVGIYANYFYHWNFCSTAVLFGFFFYTVAMGMLLVVDSEWQFALVPSVFLERHAAQVAVAALLLWFGIWVIGSVALAASTRLNVMLNAITCFVVFFVGMSSQFLFGQFAEKSVAAWAAMRVVPNMHVFWVGDKLMQELPFIPLPYVGTAAAYAVGYCATMVMVAAFLFEKREVV